LTCKNVLGHNIGLGLVVALLVFGLAVRRTAAVLLGISFFWPGSAATLLWSAFRNHRMLRLCPQLEKGWVTRYKLE
jgi:hypothetical protein